VHLSSSLGRTMDSLAIVNMFGAAWAAHDMDATLAFVTDDFAFESTEPAPDGARYEGRDSVRRAWQPIFDDEDALFEAEETFAAGDRVVQRWRYSWRGGHIRGVDVFCTRDGLVAEKLSYVKG
jgi:ketosteroid isomerase-like protein